MALRSCTWPSIAMHGPHSYACIYVPRTFLANFLRLNSVWQIILFLALLNANVSVKIFATFGERKIHSKRSLSIIMKRGAVGKYFRQVGESTDSTGGPDVVCDLHT